jgi:hypothetical protein
MKRIPVLLLATIVAATTVEFEKPFRIEAGGHPINVDIGHAAPYMYDFDGDSVRDLLVGQFGQGRLRIYKNSGSNKEPQFLKSEWFMAGGKIASIKAA